MIDWDDLRYFLAIARTGKLSRAAVRLGINPTTVGRRLGMLEEQIGARLFDRTPEGYQLTPSGRDLLPRAERMEAEASALERDIAGADREESGIVKVSVTEMIGTRFIAPKLVDFRAEYPRITIDLNCTSRDVILARREADISLRLARPREQGVVTRKLAPIPLALYASRTYIASKGKPNGGAFTAGHNVVMFVTHRRFGIENEWMEARVGQAQIAMRSDSVSAVYSAVHSGLGIGLLPDAVALDEPSLVRLDSDGAPEPRMMWIAVHEDLQHTARIRRVMDFLASLVSPESVGAVPQERKPAKHIE